MSNGDSDHSCNDSRDRMMNEQDPLPPILLSHPSGGFVSVACQTEWNWEEDFRLYPPEGGGLQASGELAAFELNQMASRYGRFIVRFNSDS